MFLWHYFVEWIGDWFAGYRRLRMTRLTIAWLLLLATSLHAQTITVGDAIPDKDVDAAKRTLESAQPKVLKLAVGEFELIEPAKTVTQALLWLPSDNPIMQRIEIPAGQSHSIFGIRRGEKKATNHVFQARPTSWCIVIGVATGQNTVTLIKSGDKPELAPVVVDTISVTVGVPTPVPTPVDPVDPIPVPSTDALVIAAQADIKAGNGTVDDVKAVIALYQTVAGKLSGGQQFATMGDFYNSFKAAGQTMLGDPAKVLPTLREAIAKDLDKNLETNPASPFEPNRKHTATVLKIIADRLGVK